MFFERVQGNDVYNAALNPPFAYQPSANNVYFSNPNASPTNPNPGASTQQYFPSNMTTLKYNYPNPGTGDWSFGITARGGSFRGGRDSVRRLNRLGSE